MYLFKKKINLQQYQQWAQKKGKMERNPLILLFDEYDVNYTLIEINCILLVFFYSRYYCLLQKVIYFTFKNK